MSELDPLDREIDNVIGALHADSRDLRVFFPVFASKLADALPDDVEIARYGSFLTRRRPIRSVTVRLGDDILEAELTPEGLVCRETRLLDGLTEEIGLDAWMRVLAAALRARARSTADAVGMLRSLLT